VTKTRRSSPVKREESTVRGVMTVRGELRSVRTTRVRKKPQRGKQFVRFRGEVTGNIKERPSPKSKKQTDFWKKSVDPS